MYGKDTADLAQNSSRACERCSVYKQTCLPLYDSIGLRRFSLANRGSPTMAHLAYSAWTLAADADV